MLWQEQNPTVQGGAETWARDIYTALHMLNHSVGWLYGKQIQLAVEQWKPDAVIIGTIHNFIGLEQAIWLGEQRIPSIWMLHDYWPFCSTRMLMQDHNRSDRGCEAVNDVCAGSCGEHRTDRVADLVNCFYSVTGCEGAAEILRRNGIANCGVIEEGIDTDFFKPGERKQTGSPVVYSSAAANDLWKGMHILRQALDGTGLDMKLLTGVSREGVATQLGNACIYAFPSVYQETWGLALTEAMGSGCAVVAFDVAGARAQIHDKSMGILVPTGDVIALREAILELAGNPRMAAEMGEAARAHVVEDHSLEAFGKRWEAACKEVAAVCAAL